MKVAKQYDLAKDVVRVEFACGCVGDFESRTDVYSGAVCVEHDREWRRRGDGAMAHREQMVKARDAFIAEAKVKSGPLVGADPLVDRLRQITMAADNLLIHENFRSRQSDPDSLAMRNTSYELRRVLGREAELAHAALAAVRR